MACGPNGIECGYRKALEDFSMAQGLVAWLNLVFWKLTLTEVQHAVLLEQFTAAEMVYKDALHKSTQLAVCIDCPFFMSDQNRAQDAEG